MANFDRDRFRAAPLSTVTSTVQETKKYDTYFGSSKEFASFWKNVDGVKVKRVLPAHEPGDSPYVPMLTTMLKCEVEDKNSEGQVIGKKIANKKIFIATLHGGLPFDITEEYIKRVYEQAEQIQDKNDKARFLNPITGYRMGGANGTWVPGIRPQLEYVYYALIDGKIWRDSLKPKQMEALNKESADLCAQNDTAAVDMFSDPSTGLPIQWSQGKDDNGKKDTTIKSLPLKMGQSWDDYFEKNAVPDKILEDLLKLPSLQELYVDSYKKRDFDLELEGLKRFDKENVYNIFAQEDFLDLVEQMANLVAERSGDEAPAGGDDLPWNGGEAPKQPAQSAPKAKPAATPKPSARKAAPKKPAGPTPEEMLAVVNKEFIAQYGDGYEELELEGDELKEMYELAVKHEDLGYDIPHVDGWGEPSDEQEAPQPEEEAPEEAPAPEPVKAAPKGTQPPADAGAGKAMSAIERIRAARNKNK